MRSLLPRLLLAAGILVSGGCAHAGPTESAERLTLYVAAQTAPCTGVGPQTCLLVREDPREAWGLFYSGIEGFTHEAGFAYTLEVLRTPVPNPPADGSSLDYRLLRVLERRAEPAS